MPEFKIAQGAGSKRKETTVSISIPDLVKFNKIKGFLSFKQSRNVESQEVVHELILAWAEKNGVVGDSN